MTYLVLETVQDERQDDEHAAVYDGYATVRVVNPAKETGEEGSGPLSWFNSARITTDPDDDAVHCVVSVGDPRGGFCFTVCRKPDGTLLIHTPYPGEGMAHEETHELHPGTLVVGHKVGAQWKDGGIGFTPADYSDPEPEWRERLNELGRERLVELVESVGAAAFDDETDDELRECIAESIEAGDIDAEGL